MKHNFAIDPVSDQANGFRAWLEAETVKMLKCDAGDIEGVKSTAFLFVKRAYESQMPETEIGKIFSRALVIAGYSEQAQDQVFTLMEEFAQIAKLVHQSE